MKVKRANKLPEKEGFYWYMLDGALRLVQVTIIPNQDPRWKLAMDYPGAYNQQEGYVHWTKPNNWSEQVEFED